MAPGQDVRDDARAATPIEGQPLSNRTLARLREGGVETVEELARRSDDELLAIRGFGHTCLREARAFLRAYRDGEPAATASPADGRFPRDLPGEARALRLERLPVSNRARGVFRREGIETVGEYVDRGRDGILRLRNFGETTFHSVNRAIHAATRALEDGGADRFQSPETLTTGGDLDDALARLPVAALDLPRRARRACRELGLRTLRDLSHVTSRDLLHRRNFGQATLRRIQAEMERLLADPSRLGAPDSFAGLLDAILSRLQPKERLLVELREGHEDGGPRTLTQAGAAMEITESRACQIEHAAWAKLRRFAAGVTDDAAERCLNLLRAEGGVAPPDALAGDPYFGGELPPRFVARMLARLLPHRLAELSDGRLAAVPAATLATLSARLRKRLLRNTASLPLAGLTEEVFRGLEPESERERTALVRALCEVLFKREVATDPDGARVVRTPAQGMGDDLRRVLLDADGPLHFSEITERLRRPPFGRDDLTEEKVRLRLCRDDRFVLMKRGEYDIRERLAVTDADRARLADRALEVLRREGRPTSVALVSQALRDEGDQDDDLSEFVLALVMRDDPRFSHLGRGTFVPAECGGERVLHVSEILGEILEEAGGPMRYADLRTRVQERRRVSDGAISATLVGRDTFVRVARGVFDLAARYPYDDGARERLAREARARLASAEGVLSLADLVARIEWSEAPPSDVLLGDLLRRHGGFRFLSGGFVSLADTKLERSLRDRALTVLREGTEPLRPSTIARRLRLGQGALALLRAVLKDDEAFAAQPDGRYAPRD